MEIYSRNNNEIMFSAFYSYELCILHLYGEMMLDFNAFGITHCHRRESKA